jgi:hypothetical protein
MNCVVRSHKLGELEIELEAVNPNATRIRIVAKQGVFFKDRVTATEIIL